MTHIGNTTSAISDAITKANADAAALSALVRTVTTTAPTIISHIRTAAQVLGLKEETLRKFNLFSSTKTEKVDAVLIEEKSSRSVVVKDNDAAVNIQNSDIDRMQKLGQKVAKKDDREAFEEAAEFLAIAMVEESGYSRLWIWFEEGARNYVDGQYHLDAIQRRLKNRAEELYLEAMS